MDFSDMLNLEKHLKNLVASTDKTNELILAKERRQEVKEASQSPGKWKSFQGKEIREKLHTKVSDPQRMERAYNELRDSNQKKMDELIRKKEFTPSKESQASIENKKKFVGQLANNY